MSWQDDPVVSEAASSQQPAWANDPIAEEPSAPPPAPATQQTPLDPSAGGGTLRPFGIDTGVETPQSVNRMLAGAGKAFSDLGRGAMQYSAEVGNVMGLGRVLPNEFSDERIAQLRSETGERRASDAPLMSTPAGLAGNLVGNVAAAAPAVAVPGANTAAGAAITGTIQSALQPVTQDSERAINTALGFALAPLAHTVGGKVASWARDKLATRAATAASAQSQNAVRDATLQTARKAGYVVPPSTTNPSATNRILESVSGKAATHQSAAVKNQKITNRLVREELGLGSDAPLTKQTLNSIRAQEGTVYKAVKNSGRMSVDDQYIDDLAKLSEGVDEIAKDFPELNIGANREIHTLTDNLLKDSFESSSAVELIKQLRKEASSNLSFAAAADPAKRALGHAQRDAAGAVEDMLVRHLNSTGKGNLATRFDAARTRIAKTYSVEAALNEGTGNVVASQLGNQLKRGKPLSGNFETIAKFAQAFPEAARELKSSAGVSAVDAIIGTVGGTTLSPALFALPAARIGTREALLSKAGQSLTTAPSYAPGTSGDAILKAIQQGRRAALPASAYAAQQE